MLDQSEKRVYYQIRLGLREVTDLIQDFKVGSKIQSFLQVKLENLERLARNPPSKRIHDANVSCLKQKNSETEHLLILPKLQKGLLGEVLLQKSRFYRHLWDNLQVDENPGFIKAAQESSLLLGTSSEKLREESCSEVIHWEIIGFAKICSLEKISKFIMRLYSVSSVDQLMSTIRAKAIFLHSQVRKMKNPPPGSVRRLEKFISTGKLTKEDIEVDISEMAEIYKAMQLGSGHWYRFKFDLIRRSKWSFVYDRGMWRSDAYI